MRSELVVFLFLQLWTTLSSAEPCPEDPNSSKILQLTKMECECCANGPSIVAHSEFAYLLFYSSHGSRINNDITMKYEKLYEEWKHTKVVFGKVDVNVDKEFAEQWLQPNQIPTNIIFYKGKPVVIKTEDFKKILDLYQGSPEGQKWLINTYLGDKKPSFHYAYPIESSTKLQKKLLLEAPGKEKKDVDNEKKKSKKSKAFFVGFFPGLAEKDARVRIWREAVWWKDRKKTEKTKTLKPETVMTFSISASKDVLKHKSFVGDKQKKFLAELALDGTGKMKAGVAYFEKNELVDSYIIEANTEPDSLTKWMNEKTKKPGKDEL